GVAITAWLRLLDEMQPGGEIPGSFGVSVLIARGDDQANLVDPSSIDDFFKNDPKGFFLDPVPIDQGLQGKSTLVTSGGGDDRFTDVHGEPDSQGGSP